MKYQFFKTSQTFLLVFFHKVKKHTFLLWCKHRSAIKLHVKPARTKKQSGKDLLNWKFELTSNLVTMTKFTKKWSSVQQINFQQFISVFQIWYTCFYSPQFYQVRIKTHNYLNLINRVFIWNGKTHTIGFSTRIVVPTLFGLQLGYWNPHNRKS